MFKLRKKMFPYIANRKLINDLIANHAYFRTLFYRKKTFFQFETDLARVKHLFSPPYMFTRAYPKPQVPPLHPLLYFNIHYQKNLKNRKTVHI